MAARSFFVRPPRVTLAATALLIAWMPSLLFFGHWTELSAPSAHHAMTVATHHGGASVEGDTPTDSEAAQHALHCHGSSSCADQGGSASAFHDASSSPLALTSRPLEVMTSHAAAAPIEGLANARPTAPPPRMAA
ncbi:MAG: hypothetical protein R3C39_13825 [Dehalococcoidia bacterium]